MSSHHLLVCHLPDSPTVQQLDVLYNLAPLHRKAKADALRFPQKKAASLAAGLLEALAKRRGAVYTSLSHSGEYAACAYGDLPIGVDVQKILPVRSGLPERTCGEEELHWLDQQEDPETAFIQLWALKEAYYKVTGVWCRQLFALPTQDWSLSTQLLSGGYLIALCFHQPHRDKGE